MPFTLERLPYDNNALEPTIDAQTMEIHHDKHHKAYVDNLNKALAGTPEEDAPLADIVAKAGSLAPAVRNNAGGHWNHDFFWNILSARGGGEPTDAALKEDINSTFGSFEDFKKAFSDAGLGRFGSGWVWLIVVPKTHELKIVSTPNQDNPLMDVAETKGTPILGVDVWEHAYYLKYKNVRAEYLSSIWNVIDWNKVAEKYTAAIRK